MQSDQLLTAIQATLKKEKVLLLAQIASNPDFSVKELIDLTFHPDQQIGFRAAWILENLYTVSEGRFLPHLRYFSERFPEQENRSAQRHFAKILSFITHRKASPAVKSAFAAADAEGLISVVFDWLLDKETPVAIKSHCLSILANLSAGYPWIKNELLQTMEFMESGESIGFFAKVKQIRKQLR